MKNLLIISVLFLMSSCWAPRCPMDTCRVRMEHVHGDLVSGVYSGRKLHKPTLHYIWEKDDGQSSTKFEGESRKKRKARKKFPWENW